MGSKTCGVALLLILAFVPPAVAGNPYCRTGYGTYGYGSGYYSNGETGVILRPSDGTYWIDGVQQERVKVQLQYKSKDYPDGWKWGFVPKGGPVKQLGQPLFPYAQQGNTAFGYTINSTYASPSYNLTAQSVQPDPAQFMNYAYRLGEQQQSNAKEGYDRFVSAATKLNEDFQDTNRLVNTAQAFAIALQSTNPQRVERSLTATTNLGTQPALQSQNASTVGLMSVLNKCVKCHTGAAAEKNGFDANQWANLNAEEWDLVVQKVTSHGDDRMPKGGDPLAPMELLPVLERAAQLHQVR